MATGQTAANKPDKCAFAIIIDAKNDFAIYYEGSMSPEAMTTALTNLKYIMNEDVAVAFDHGLGLHRLSSLRSANSLTGDRYQILCRTTEDENQGGSPGDQDETPSGGENSIGSDVSVVDGVNEEATGHIPRPRNRWILYRQYMSRQLREQDPSLTAGQISTIVSEMWSNETLEVKDHFQRLAEEDAAEHKKKYPGYKYEARKAGTKKRKHQ